MKPGLRFKALVAEALDAFWATIKAAPVYAEHVEVMEAAELERVAMRAAGAWMQKAGVEENADLPTPEPYRDPDPTCGAHVHGSEITMGDLQRLSLREIAHEIARRAEVARVRGNVGDRDRFLRLRRAANELRIVGGAPPFAWPEGS